MVIRIIYPKSEENIDAQSRMKNIDTEWELAPYAYNKIKHKFKPPEIDLFATRINTKCKDYCSWFEEPDALAIDAFTIPWNNLNFYAFPPFSIIAKVFHKIINKNAITAF